MSKTYRTTVYLLDTEPLKNETLYLSCLKKLSDGRKAKTERFKNAGDKIRCVGAGILLRAALMDNGLPDDAAIDTEKNGKPYLRDYPDIHFSLSHSGNMVMCVISPYECGCDTEQIAPGHLKLLKRFSENENKLVLSYRDESDRDRVFTRLWTLRESYMKYTGKGLSLPFSQYEIKMDGDKPYLLGGNAFLQEFSLFDGYCFSLCTEKKTFPEIKTLDPKTDKLSYLQYPDFLNIALLQIAPTGSLKENAEKGATYCRKAKQMGADIALFPEMFSNGYDIYERPTSSWKNDAILEDSEYILTFKKLANELNMSIGITMLEETEDDPANTLILFDRHGKKVLKYRKVHTCDFDVERNLTPGNSFPVCTLDTAKGNVKVGAMICYDREFPEPARILMLEGAELILVPNACPMEQNRLSQLRGRAFENMVSIATCNYPGGVPDCNGHSTLFDGAVYLPNLPGSRDTCIIEAGEDEGIYMGHLDFEMLKEYRVTEMQGNCYRHPELYQKITEEKIEYPFIREGYRKTEKES